MLKVLKAANILFFFGPFPSIKNGIVSVEVWFSCGVEMYKEAGLLLLAVHANLAAAKLRERALRHTQETPIAQAAASSIEPRIRRHGAGGAART